MSHPHPVKKKISVDVNANLSIVRTVQEIKKDVSQVKIKYYSFSSITKQIS